MGRLGEGLSTARRWQILAPRSWPPIMRGTLVDEGSMEERILRMARDWLVLEWGIERTADRP
jgi:hypothetical protein